MEGVPAGEEGREVIERGMQRGMWAASPQILRRSSGGSSGK